jgi:4-amino-4-deoxy-L-arabinose transferase-like glycosyltransferase
MSKKIRNNLYQVAIVLVGTILFIPFLGNVHLFDWDEINFAESAREMIVSKDYLTVQINFQPFWEKPPLFTWFQVVSMKLFGINEFAARFPNAIGGIITLLLVYKIGKKLYNQRFGLLWALVYAGSLLPHFYFKSGIIDPWFNLFIFLGIYFFFCFNEAKKSPLKWVMLSGAFVGLGILTKGPVAFLIFFLSAVIYMVVRKSYKTFLQPKVILVYALSVSLVGGLWFILQILNGNYNILIQFIEYQIRLFTQEDAGHGGFLLYHFVVLFLGVFPASVFMLKSFRKDTRDTSSIKDFKLWMLIVFWVVLILFTIVNTKIVHYSSMCYFPMTFLATYIIHKIYDQKQRFDGWMKVLIATIASIYAIAVAGLQLFAFYKEVIINKGFIKDKFAVANLEAEVNWSGFEFLVGIVLLVGMIITFAFIKNHKTQIVGVFISSLLFMNLSLAIIVPKIEQYSQNAAITFYRSIANEDCYLDTFEFKSYAIYYYFDKAKPENHKAFIRQWLLTGDIDKPVYIVCKVTSENRFMQKHPTFRKLGSKNGFSFFKREINSTH